MLPPNLPVVLEKLRREASSPGIAYRRALEIERLRATTDQIGYSLYALNEGGLLGRSELDQARDHVTIGRHTSCDFVLPATDQAISLRHALVRLSVLDDGLPLLAVLDLDSGLGFELSDGSRQRSVVASGAVTFRVGNVWIVALPMNTPCPDDLIPPRIRQIDDSSASIAPEIVDLPSPRRSAESGAPKPSQISIMPPSIRLSERATVAAPPDQAPKAAPPNRAIDPADAPSFELVLQGQGRQAGVLLSENDVTRGVLIGRDPRCVDAGLRALLDESVSRVHALVIREPRGVVLYDVGSMNGIFDGEHKIRSIVLSDAGSHMTFGGGVRVSMRWRALSRPKQ